MIWTTTSCLIAIRRNRRPTISLWIISSRHTKAETALHGHWLAILPRFSPNILWQWLLLMSRLQSAISTLQNCRIWRECRSLVLLWSTVQFSLTKYKSISARISPWCVHKWILFLIVNFWLLLLWLRYWLLSHQVIFFVHFLQLIFLFIGLLLMALFVQFTRFSRNFRQLFFTFFFW